MASQFLLTKLKKKIMKNRISHNVIIREGKTLKYISFLIFEKNNKLLPKGITTKENLFKSIISKWLSLRLLMIL